MSVEHVLKCEGFGCKVKSYSHGSETALRRFECLIHSWGRIDVGLGESEVIRFEDWCPRCMAEHFFTWVYVHIQGGDHFGSMYQIRPKNEEYVKWDRDYDPSKYEYEAGRKLTVKKGHSAERRDDGAHILPSFLFEQLLPSTRL